MYYTMYYTMYLVYTANKSYRPLYLKTHSDFCSHVVSIVHQTPDQTPNLNLNENLTKDNFVATPSSMLLIGLQMLCIIVQCFGFQRDYYNNYMLNRFSITVLLGAVTQLYIMGGGGV